LLKLYITWIIGTLNHVEGWLHRWLTPVLGTEIRYREHMLVWTECPEGWRADGFRIVLAEPFRWLLIDDDEPPTESAVRVGGEPLAVARSLTEAKREAELIALARARSAVRRRHLLTLLISASVVLMFIGAPLAGNGVLLVIAGSVAARSTMFLLGTLVPDVLSTRHNVFYQ
jgi:hypothetical protein